MDSKVVGGVKIVASRWEKNGRNRIYFGDGRTGKTGACWDLNKGKWVKVRAEFSPKFKAAIKTAFGL